MKLVAACAFGLETPVRWELEKLGYQARPSQPGRVEFEGDWIDVVKTNLWLRVADRILIQVAEFDAPDFDALFETLKSICWIDWLPRQARFPVNARSRNSSLTSIPAIQRSSKKAIVEALRNGYGCNELPEDGPVFPIEIEFLDDVARANIDTTGPSLHKRGYRKSFGQAPLKETLAAAMVMLSVWRADRPLVDPFCGSGTIPVEAALIGRNIAPGLHRSFHWQHWPQIDQSAADDVHRQAEAAIDRQIRLQISGTDIDENMLKAARRNAFYAGVVEDIHFQQKAFADLRSKKRYGCLITNPPYGQRMDQRSNLLPLYKSFPAVLQRLPTWSFFILTDLPKFEGLVQKSATRRRKLYNGRIECMYYQYLGPKPTEFSDSPNVTEQVDDASVGKPVPDTVEAAADPPAKSAPVFGGLSQGDREQAELFATRLKKRSRHLRRWPSRRGITCFRIYDRDIPELPFVVERYEDCIHVTHYDRPHDRDPGRQAAWLDLMKKTLASTLDVPIQHVSMKVRHRQAGNLQHGRLDNAGEKTVVHEGGLKFLVNLSDYVDTGLFLDHRMTRQMVREEAAGKNFLNLFGYTGSFTVYAASGNAKSTTTVDWSKTYLDWAQENMRLNGFIGPQHQYRRQDAMEFLNSGPTQDKFDLVVVDPPTFSNSKRTDQIWDVQKNHVELLQRLSEWVVSGGIVYFSTNFRRFKFELPTTEGFRAREISQQTVPEDFRSRRVHRCWKLERV